MIVLFPLPLTPFEHYYWCDDRPGYPTSFPVELAFSGVLDQEAFTQAWATVVARHPLLSAHVDDSERWPAWVPAQRQDHAIDWADRDAPIRDVDTETIDLKTTSGVKAWVRTGEAATRVRLRFHHACCDGLGALQFIEDLLISYARNVCGEKCMVSLPPLDAEQLRSRGGIGQVVGHDTPEYRTKLRDVFFTAYHWIKLLMRRPTPMATPDTKDADNRTPHADNGFAAQFLDAADTKALRRAATSCGVTFNDVLLGDLFQVARDWNVAHGDSSNGWLRFNMPVSLRVRANKTLPAANRLSFSFITRRARDCDDSAQLLQSIHDETEAIKQKHLSLYFLGGLGFGGAIRGMLPWFLNRNRCFATMVLSNAGRVLARTGLPRQDGRLVCGNVTLEQITGAPPIRPLTRASIVVLNYAGRLAINLKCDPQSFSAAQTDELLGRYVRQLKRRAAGHSADS